MRNCMWKRALLVIGGVLVATNFAYGQNFAGQWNSVPEAATCVDVVLAPGGVLRGQVQNSQAAPCQAIELLLTQVGREPVRTITNEQGMFELNGVRGGAYAVVAGGTSMDVRLWMEGTSPPTARNALLVVARGDVARGQGAGGTFWRTVTNPWVSAGLIGAAIAVPIALNNNDSGS